MVVSYFTGCTISTQKLRQWRFCASSARSFPFAWLSGCERLTRGIPPRWLRVSKTVPLFFPDLEALIPHRDKQRAGFTSPKCALSAPTTVKESARYSHPCMLMKSVRDGRRNFLFSVEGFLFFGKVNKRLPLLFVKHTPHTVLLSFVEKPR